MDDHLTKPLSVRTLGAVIARATGAAANDPATNAVETQPPDRSGSRDDATDAPRPILDPAIVDRLERVGRTAGEDLMGRLTVLFLDDAEVGVDAMRSALAADDTVTVTRCAHTLGGASANLGAAHLSQLCAALEKMGATADRANRGKLLSAVDVELGRVRSALGALAVSR
jgi:two-component system sensor histidine kinase/response regulator